jgi:hypothetical protein
LRAYSPPKAGNSDNRQGDSNFYRVTLTVDDQRNNDVFRASYPEVIFSGTLPPNILKTFDQDVVDRNRPEVRSRSIPVDPLSSALDAPEGSGILLAEEDDLDYVEAQDYYIFNDPEITQDKDFDFFEILDEGYDPAFDDNARDPYAPIDKYDDVDVTVNPDMIPPSNISVYDIALEEKRISSDGKPTYTAPVSFTVPDGFNADDFEIRIVKL